ncbi:hypothetical protein PQR62_17725 [Herbaspirillum lusitanum]|uniref:Uncharacterized protein n=1 Tax=Herbaspirillum lusitanum TaxID=213312 RepID=A0ABW9ADZ9_9BURK
MLSAICKNTVRMACAMGRRGSAGPDTNFKIHPFNANINSNNSYYFIFIEGLTEAYFPVFTIDCDFLADRTTKKSARANGRFR